MLRGAPEAGEAVYVRVLKRFLPPSSGVGLCQGSQPQGPRREKPFQAQEALRLNSRSRRASRGRGRALEINQQFRRPLSQLTERNRSRLCLAGDTFHREAPSLPLSRPWGQPRGCARARAASGTLGAAGPPFWGCGSPPRTGIPDRTNPELGRHHPRSRLLTGFREAGLAHDPRKQMVSLMRQVGMQATPRPGWCGASGQPCGNGPCRPQEQPPQALGPTVSTTLSHVPPCVPAVKNPESGVGPVSQNAHPPRQFMTRHRRPPCRTLGLTCCLLKHSHVLKVLPQLKL